MKKSFIILLAVFVIAACGTKSSKKHENNDADLTPDTDSTSDKDLVDDSDEPLPVDKDIDAEEPDSEEDADLIPDKDDLTDADITNDSEVLPDIDIQTDGDIHADNDIYPDGDTRPDIDVQPDSDVVTDSDSATDDSDTPVKDVEFCRTLTKPATGLCSVEGAGTNLLIRGNILGYDKAYQGGEVLVSAAGIILCSGCDCSQTEGYSDVKTVTCAEGVVSPGLINAHDHITYSNAFPTPSIDIAERFDHRHDWRKGLRGHNKISVAGGASKDTIVWAEIRQLMGGSTTIAGSGDVAGFLRNIDGVTTEGLAAGKDVENDTFPLDDSAGTLLADSCTYGAGMVKETIVNEHNCFLPHVAEGIDKEARNELLCLNGHGGAGSVDVTAQNSAFIHSIGALAIDGQDLATSGTAVIWSPRSNISLYGNTAPVTMYKTQGVQLGIGTDWLASGSMNIQRELQCADYLNTNHFNKFFSDKELWKMATINNAEALVIGDVIGSIRPGLIADLAIFDGTGAENFYRAVIDANQSKVALVTRTGKALYGDPNIVTALRGDTDCEAIPDGICGAAKSLCVKGETGNNFAYYSGKAGTWYPAFFCGTPTDEPSCVPQRTRVADELNPYTGEITDLDKDGDGIANENDNCPLIFNPIRPVDNAKQADYDNDGAGDVCDPCPMDANTTECKPVNPNDADNDGFENVADNCPNNPNPLQEDKDLDGAGDLCDRCPSDPNPGNSACPATIYQIKKGEINGAVTVTGVVTGVAADGTFFMQVITNDPAYEGAEFSGIFVYRKLLDASTPAVGDLVDVTGTSINFYGEIELSNVTNVTKLASSQPIPDPVEIADPATVSTTGADKEKYEGVLISVANLEVTELKTQYNEFKVNASLWVDDLFYLANPFPVAGDKFFSITGILRWANSDSKIEPRNEDDIVVSNIPALESILPAENFVKVGETANLTVSLDKPAIGATVITITSSNPLVASVPQTVTIPDGETSVIVPVTGVAENPNKVTISAVFGNPIVIQVTAFVTVIAADRIPVVTSIDPAATTITIGATKEFTVTLDIPATDTHKSFALSQDVVANGVVNIPATVDFTVGATTAKFLAEGVTAGTLQIWVDDLVKADVEVVAASTETVPNGGFETWTTETLPDNWTGDTGLGVAKESTIKRTGNYSVKLTRNATDAKYTNFTSDFVPVEVGKTYAITYHFLDNYNNIKGRHAYQFFKADKTTAIASPVYGSYTVNSADWQELTKDVTAPAEAAYVKVITRLYGDVVTATGGFLYLDDVEVVAK